MSIRPRALFVTWLALGGIGGEWLAADEIPPLTLDAISRVRELADERIPSPRLAEVVEAAFRQAHDGWSSDKVLLDDELNKLFLTKCRELTADGECDGLSLTAETSGTRSGQEAARA